MQDTTREQADAENARWLAANADPSPLHLAWQAARQAAAVARDNYLAAIHGQAPPLPEGASRDLNESYSAYLYQRMVVAALTYAQAANAEAEAQEALTP